MCDFCVYEVYCIMTYSVATSHNIKNISPKYNSRELKPQWSLPGNASPPDPNGPAKSRNKNLAWRVSVFSPDLTISHWTSTRQTGSKKLSLTLLQCWQSLVNKKECWQQSKHYWVDLMQKFQHFSLFSLIDSEETPTILNLNHAQWCNVRMLKPTLLSTWDPVTQDTKNQRRWFWDSPANSSRLALGIHWAL